MESGSGNLSKLCSVSLLGQREGAGGGRMAKQESFSLLALTLTALDVWDGPGRRSNYLAGSFESAFLLERPRLLSVCTETEPNRTERRLLNQLLQGILSPHSGTEVRGAV